MTDADMDESQCQGHHRHWIGDECLHLYRHLVNWYEAQYRCVESGGELATFAGYDSAPHWYGRVVAAATAGDLELWIGLSNRAWTTVSGGESLAHMKWLALVIPPCKRVEHSMGWVSLAYNRYQRCILSHARMGS